MRSRDKYMAKVRTMARTKGAGGWDSKVRKSVRPIHEPRPKRTGALDLAWVKSMCSFPDSGCWIWMGSKDGGGYGRTYLAKRNRSTHELVWIMVGRDLISGLEFDHLCRRRACCNPDHLELVTHEENMKRSHIVKTNRPCQQCTVTLPHKHIDPIQK